MAATAKAVLRVKGEQDGPIDVYLVLTNHRKPSYLSLGFAVLPKHWNADASLQQPKWVRAGNLAADTYNSTIQKRLKLAYQWLDKQPAIDSKTWRDKVKEGLEVGAPVVEAEEDFFEYYAQEVARRQKAGKVRTAERLANILSKLREFQLTEHQQATLWYSQLTPRFVRDYRDWLVREKGNKGQTPDKELSFIKTIVRLAVDDGKLDYHKNPFLKIKLSTPPSKKEKLSDEEVGRIEHADLPAHKWYQVCRDAWMLQYHLYGSRVADVLLLRWSCVSATEVRFQEQKTGKWKAVGRHQRLDELLQRYQGHTQTNDFVLPLLDAREWYTRYPEGMSIADLESSKAFSKHYEALLRKLESNTTKINQYIKKIGALVGITKHITNHVARHSFTAMARRSGVSSFDLRDMLNHESVEQTEKYAGELEKDELAARAPGLYGITKVEQK